MPWDGDIDFCLTKADVAKYVKYFEKTVRKTFQIELNIFVKHLHFYKKKTVQKVPQLHPPRLPWGD